LAAEPILKVGDLHSGYGEMDILRGVNLDLKQGVTTVIGPNGAGKSTLLKTIFGMARISSGTIELFGEDIRGLSNRKLLELGLAFVPQGRCNFPRMTIHENLEMGAFTMPTGKARSAIAATYEKFPVLQDARRKFASELSGGQQQILEMAMALVTSPRLLLIDEPSLGLAPITLAGVLDEVQSISKQGVPVLMVEQNARQALERSDSGVVLDLGRKALEGTGAEMLNDPRLAELYLGGAATSSSTVAHD
jgi:branched-chain amino acid transport system ATP-binding protein